VFDWVLTGQAQMVIGRRAVPSTDDESRFAPRCLRRWAWLQHRSWAL